MFAALLVFQWLASIATAIWATSQQIEELTTPHVPLLWRALGLGAPSSPPHLDGGQPPGQGLTRQQIAIGQGMLTAMLSTPRADGARCATRSSRRSRSWRCTATSGVLLLASLIGTIDHVLGCYLWPHSVYGVGQVTNLAWVGDVTFILVEDVLLILAIRKSQSDMLGDARRQATIDGSQLAMEREVAERQRTERLLSLQYVITRVLAGANSLTEAAPLILRIMGENQGWHVGELWEVEEGRQHLRCVDAWHAPAYPKVDYLEERRAAKVVPDEGLAGRVWQRHLPLWIPDVAEEPTMPMAAFAEASGLHGAFAIPLRNGPEVIGVMAFYSTEVRQANDDHLSMLSALGGQIGQFMERKRIEQGLRDSEERYRSVIAALDEGITWSTRAGA